MARNKAGAVKRKKLRKLKREEARKNPKPRGFFSRQPRSLEDLDRMEREQQQQNRIIPFMPGMDYLVPLLLASKMPKNEIRVVTPNEGKKENE